MYKDRRLRSFKTCTVAAAVTRNTAPACWSVDNGWSVDDEQLSLTLLIGFFCTRKGIKTFSLATFKRFALSNSEGSGLILSSRFLTVLCHYISVHVRLPLRA